MKKINVLTKCFLAIFLWSFSFSQISAQGTISGTITDVKGETLIGATVTVVSTDDGTVTDIDGRYSLELANGDYVIAASYTGFQRMLQTITVSSNNQTFDFVLQTDLLNLDEVVVTATYSTRSQKDSPLSISLIDGAKIQQLAASSQADILRTVPGITAEGGGGEVATNIFVRGLPGSGQFQYTPLQVDGLPVLSTFGLNSSSHDVFFRNDIGIRNLEFVRGGSATLFGAGSTAGIVNYTSVTGSIDPENKVQLEWAEGGRAKMDFLSAGPLNDKTFYAVSGFYRYDEGPLETGLIAKGAQIRGNIKRLLNDGNGSFTISGQFIDDQVPFYLPYPLENDNGTFSRPTGNDGETVYTQLTGQITNVSFDTPNGRFESPIENGVVTRGGYIMMDMKQSFGDDWILSAKGKYAKYKHEFNLFLDGDGRNSLPLTQTGYLEDVGLPSNATFTYVDDNTPLSASDFVYENRVLDRSRPMEELSSTVNLTKAIDNHNLTIGTFAAHTEVGDDNWIWNFLGDFSNSPRIVNLSYTDSLGNDQVYANNGFIGGRQTSNKTLSATKYAFYLADEYKGEKFNLDVAVRYEKMTGKLNLESGVGSNAFNRGDVEADGLGLSLAGLYKLNKTTNVYANFSRGFFFPQIRSLGFVSPGVPQTYDAENILQGEAGVKIGGKSFAATAAVFYVGLTDRRNVDLVNDGSGGITEAVTIQDSRTIGLEGTINYAVTDDFIVGASLTLQDPQLTKNEGNPELEGNQVRRFPKAMGMLSLDYDNDVFDASLSANYIGKKFTNDANSVELDAYSIVRFDVGYTVGLAKDHSMRIGLSVFNLLDADGVTEGSPRQGNAQTPGGSFFVGRPILPRRIFVRLGFDF